MRPVTVSVSAITLNATGVAAAQQPSGNVALVVASQTGVINTPATLNGSLAAGGIVGLPKASRVTITSSSNLSAVSFQVNGRDDRGQVVQDTIVGPNNTTVAGLVSFRVITSVIPLAASAAYSVGAYPNELVLTSWPVTLATPRPITVVTSGDASAYSYKVTGTDRANSPITETVAGASTGTTVTKRLFKTVTGIQAIGASFGPAVNVSAGWAATPNTSDIIVVEHRRNPFQVSLGCIVTGTVNYDVQHTFENPMDLGFNDGLANWFSHADLNAQSASADGNYSYPPRAVRLILNSGSGSVSLELTQAGD